MPLQPPLVSVALKRMSAAMGKRAPRARSIDGWFCRQPWPESVADRVVPPGCHLALVAARAPLGVLGEGAQSGNTLATTLGGPTGVGLAGLWPMCDVLRLLPHDARSDSRADKSRVQAS